MAASDQFTGRIPSAQHAPPWGITHLREYDRLIAEYAKLHRNNVLEKDGESTAKEMQLLNAADIARALAVADWLRLMRYAIEDAPQLLESLLRPIVDSVVTPDLVAIAKDMQQVRQRRAG